MNTSASQFCSFLFIQRLLPMQNPVAIRAKRNTFGDNFGYRPSVRAIPNQVTNGLLIRANNVVKIKGGGMRKPAKHTFLGFFKLNPHFSVLSFIFRRRGSVFFFIFLIPTPIVFCVFNASDFGIFIRHVVFK